ncbi:MAG: NAD(P)-binding domain-containing protein [Devosia sp.]
MLPATPATRVALKLDIVIIGAGQAGLSAAYNLKQLGLAPGRDFAVLDAAPQAGGAWQYRWPSLTLSTVNKVHDLPGMSFAASAGSDDSVQAAIAVPRYFAAYEDHFDLQVRRPVAVNLVCNRGARLRIETDHGLFSARGLINATGTWEKPFIPDYPGAASFTGRQLHTRDYKTAADFAGQHVLVVGAGISAIQLLDEISRVTTTSWVSRTPPRFRQGSFTPEDGRAAVKLVEDRVRQGLPPGSVVSVTGLPRSPAIEAMQQRGVLNNQPMFQSITPTGVRWADGRELAVDVILWCTGFRSALDHLAPLQLREPSGGITMTGRLATKVAADPRIHLVGYGPSASTIGANRAGAAAAKELVTFLSERPVALP